MDNAIVLVPIYRPELWPLERYTLDHYLAALAGRTIKFIGPHTLDRSFYSEHYQSVPFLAFDDAFFASVEGYNRLLLSPWFYEQFAAYEFVLVLQTDAVVLRDELDFWCAQPYDYIGAPWPDGYKLFVNAGKFAGDNGKYVVAYVGNGGLSLRRVSKCILLLEEFGDIVGMFDHSGSSEDLFFSVMGMLSEDFRLPDEATASLFALELKPSHYRAVNGGRLPMGGHAWWSYEPGFWLAAIGESPPPRPGQDPQ